MVQEKKKRIRIKASQLPKASGKTQVVRKAILAAMRQQNMTTYELCIRSGVSMTTVYNFIRGDELGIKLTSAEKLMEVLGLDALTSLR